MSATEIVDFVALISAADALKEEGNAALKLGDHTTAVQKYTAGLEKLNDVPEGTEKKNDVKKSLSLNLALSTMKLEQWFDCIKAAGDALAIEPTNVKALYRRGIARSKYGMPEQAKDDFNEILKIEPGNADARRELVALKPLLADSKQAEKKKFSGMFSKSLYTDKEKETERKRVMEEEQRKVRKSTWEKEMERRKQAGEEGADQSFEDWDAARAAKEEADRIKFQKEHATDFTPYGQKERDEAAEKEKAANAKPLTPEEEAKRKADEEAKKRAMEEARQRRAAERKAREAEEMELDEEEQKILEETKKMGYCYFRRDLTEEEKKAREEQLKPIKFDASAHESATDQQYAKDIVETAQQAAQQAQEGKAISSWNSGGTTYEEKDVSEAAKEAARAALQSVQATVTAENAAEVLAAGQKQRPMQLPASVGDANALVDAVGGFAMLEVTKCSALEGDASIALVRGTKRFLYDFNGAKLTFKAAIDGGATSVEGTLALDELSSTRSNDETDWTRGAKVRFAQTNGASEDALGVVAAALRWAVSQRLDKFAEEFKAGH